MAQVGIREESRLKLHKKTYTLCFFRLITVLNFKDQRHMKTFLQHLMEAPMTTTGADSSKTSKGKGERPPDKNLKPGQVIPRGIDLFDPRPFDNYGPGGFRPYPQNPAPYIPRPNFVDVFPDGDPTRGSGHPYLWMNPDRTPGGFYYDGPRTTPSGIPIPDHLRKKKRYDFPRE